MFITVKQFHIYMLSLLCVINIWSHFSAHLITNIYFSLVSYCSVLVFTNSPGKHLPIKMLHFNCLDQLVAVFCQYILLKEHFSELN